MGNFNDRMQRERNVIGQLRGRRDMSSVEKYEEAQHKLSNLLMQKRGVLETASITSLAPRGGL